MLYFLYYKFNLIVKLISIICGVKIFRDANKEIKNEKRFGIVVVYYGMVGAMMLGCFLNNDYCHQSAKLLDKRHIPVIALCVVVVAGCAALKKTFKNGEEFILQFILFFQYLYVVFRFAFEVLNQDFVDKTLDDFDPIDDYSRLNYAFVFAFIVAIVLAALSSLLIKGLKNDLCYMLISIFMIVGGVLAWSVGLFYMTGEWQDLFLPWLNVEYGEAYNFAFAFFTMAIVVVSLWYLFVRDEINKMISRLF